MVRSFQGGMDDPRTPFQRDSLRRRSENRAVVKLRGAGVRATAAGPSPVPPARGSRRSCGRRSQPPCVRSVRPRRPPAWCPRPGPSGGPGDGAVAEHSLPPLLLRVPTRQRPRPGQARHPGVPTERLQVVHQVEGLPPRPGRRAVEQPRVAGHDRIRDDVPGVPEVGQLPVPRLPPASRARSGPIRRVPHIWGASSPLSHAWLAGPNRRTSSSVKRTSCEWQFMQPSRE